MAKESKDGTFIQQMFKALMKYGYPPDLAGKG